ncbi:MAG: hypothetical protein P1U41_03105, partial [Vicingaceae bacterium]|nr:hypothetical protein [Vicingaceae bacterium]
NTNTESNDKVSEEDKTILMNLTPFEITAIKESEEFKEYATLKQENRRLVKEAEVEYAEAEIYEQEATDQKQLELSLNALAAAASTDEDKAKKAAQLEKLRVMIAENESKSQELKQSAETKDKTVESNSQKTNAILINADEDVAKNYTAIEKVETFDADLMAEAMSRTNVENNENTLASNEQLENNENTNNSNERTTNNESNENTNENNVVENNTENTNTENTNTENTNTENTNT